MNTDPRQRLEEPPLWRDVLIVVAMLVLCVYFMLEDWEKHERLNICMLILFGVGLVRMVWQRLRTPSATRHQTTSQT